MSFAVIKWDTNVYSESDTDTTVYAEFECDTVGDLPARDYMTGCVLQCGSKAHVIADNTYYKMQTSGAWVLQRSADVSQLVTDISILQQEAIAASNMLINHDNRLDALEAAAVELINDGAKNMLKTEPAASTLITITMNTDGTFSASGTVPTGSVASILLGRIYGHAGEQLYLSGCPSGGSQSSGYSLLVANEAGSMIAPDEGSGLSFTAPAGENYFRVYVRFRPGTYSALTFSPMVCRNIYSQFTKKYVPYSPTNSQLAAMI